MATSLGSLWGQGAVSAQQDTPAPDFNAHFAQNYAGLDLPDNAFDALREKFFDEHVAPWAVQRGYGLSATRERYMQETARSDKSNWPRLAQVGSAALAGLVGPARLVPAWAHYADAADQIAAEAQHEAVKQGINPQIPLLGNAYTALGQGIGMAPYFATGLGEEEAMADMFGIAKGTLPRAAMRTAADSLIMGSYEAAKAQPGKGGEAFQQGAIGGALMGAIHLPGPLWRALKAQGVEEGAAKAVQQVAKGLATPAEQDLAAETMINTPHLDGKVAVAGRQFGRQKQQAGVPTDTEVGLPDGALRVEMTGADGKPYMLEAPVEQFDSITNRIVQHLQQGGAIPKLSGDPVAIQTFLKRMEAAHPEAFRLMGADGALMDNDTIKPIRVSPDYEQMLAQRLEEQGQREQQWGAASPTQGENPEEWWTQRIQEGQEAEGMQLQPPAATFGENTQTLKGGQRIIFRAKPITEADIPPTDTAAPDAFDLARGDMRNVALRDAYADGKPLPEIAQQFNMSLRQVSEELTRQLPPSTATSPDGRVRGSLDMRLNSRGDAQTQLMGRQLADQFDIIAPGSRIRAQQTAENIHKANPEALMLPPDARFDSWRRGEMEGGDPETAKNFSDALVLHAPDTPHPGVSPSGAPGESFNQFMARVIPGLREMRAIQQQTGKNVLVVTHYNPIHLYEAFLKDGGDSQAGVDFEHFIGQEEDPAHLYRVDADGLTKIDPDSVPDLRQNPAGDLYLMRHGETDFNPRPKVQPPPAVTFKRTPLANRFVVSPEEAGVGFKETEGLAPEDYGMVTAGGPWGQGAGWRPNVIYNRNMFAGGKDVVKDTIFHEGIHAGVMYHDLGTFMNLMDRKGRYNLLNEGVVKDVYRAILKPLGYAPDSATEETFAYASGFIRTGNQAKLQSMIDADTDRETFMKWYTDTADKLLAKLGEVGDDSVHTRTMERRLNFTRAQASNMIEDVRRPFEQTYVVQFQPADKMWEAMDMKTGEKIRAADKNALLDQLQDKAEPLNTPELVDTTNLPPMPRFARNIPAPSVGSAPITSDPPPPPEIKAGWLGLRGLFTPFYDWVSSVGTKYGRPDLPAAFDRVRAAWNDHQLAIEPFAETLQSTIDKYDRNRQPDFMNWMRAETDDQHAALQQHAMFSEQELKHLAEFKEQFQQLPDFMKYLREQRPRLEAADYDVHLLYPKEYDTTMIGNLLRRGVIDPRDENLANVAFNYMRGQMFHQYMKESVDAAEKLVDEEAETGTDRYTFQMVRPLLTRQIEYYRGHPDWTQKAVLSAVDQATDWINKGIDAVNPYLPEAMQMERLDKGPRDVLEKFIFYNYAGALGLRPAVPIRDALGYYLTTYPILGEKYAWKGMERAYSVAKEGWTDSDAYKTANDYGWLLHRSNVQELIAGGGEQQTGRIAQWTEKAMSAITFSQNTKRVAAGWGFAEKIMDALNSYTEHGDPKQFMKDSGFWFLGDARKAALTREAAAITEQPLEAQQKFVLRAARDMLDATQWDYSKGAAPGIYKYQLGRLFGQYGVWPMNYIEYARKFVKAGLDPDTRGEALAAFTRLGIAHGATLAAGHAVGIDASKWLFTQPMAYSGGPLYNAVINIPQSMDFQTYKGTEARRQLVEPIWPGMIPGYDEAHGLWKAVVNEEPNLWIRVLGFQPYEEKNK